jgi:hypothetical protein
VTDIGRTIFVTVIDADENTSPTTIETVKATLVNARTKQSLELTLVETGPDTGVFRNVDGIILVDPKNKGRSLGATEFEALDKDTILAFYQAPAGFAPAPPPPPVGTRTDRAESALAVCERVVPASLKPGQEAEITVRLIAKQPLTAAIISDRPDPAFTVTGDTRGGTISPLAPGQKFELKYRVRAGRCAGNVLDHRDVHPGDRCRRGRVHHGDFEHPGGRGFGRQRLRRTQGHDGGVALGDRQPRHPRRRGRGQGVHRQGEGHG